MRQFFGNIYGRLCLRDAGGHGHFGKGRAVGGFSIKRVIPINQELNAVILQNDPREEIGIRVDFYVLAAKKALRSRFTLNSYPAYDQEEEQEYHKQIFIKLYPVPFPYQHGQNQEAGDQHNRLYLGKYVGRIPDSLPGIEERNASRRCIVHKEVEENAGIDKGHAGGGKVKIEFDEPAKEALNLLTRGEIENKQSKKESKEMSMGDPSVHQEKCGRIDVIDPGDENIQVWSEPAQHQGSEKLFIKAEKAAQDIGQQCMGKEVH